MKTKDQEIIKLYQSGISITELTKTFEIHRSTAQKLLKRHGVLLHNKKSFIKCNRNFFSEYTNESCYWAGFILADGNLAVNRNMLQICLAKIDGNHLNKFLNAINCDEYDRVKYYKKYVTLKICLDEFKNDLINNFDINPQKTYDCFISDKIPKNKLNHFIRGYFDGDGSIIKSKYKSINFTGTEKVLNHISNVLKNVGVNLNSNNLTPPIQSLINGVGHISYSGNNSKIVLDWLYNNINSDNENIVLKRKFNKYKKIYEIR